MTDFRFPSSLRLHHSAEFDAVFKQVKLRVSNPAFLALARENPGVERRLGLVVGRKAAARAVDRNRLKRLIRESFRRNCQLEGLDVVIVARPAARAYSNEQVFEVLSGMWRELASKQSRQECK